MVCIATSLAPAWPRETDPGSPAASRTCPFPLKRLLVLSDLSPAADNAAWRAGLLAAEHRAWVHLVHVRPWPARDGASQRRLEATAWHLQERLQVAVLAQSVPGASRRELADAAAQADLIVVAAPPGIAHQWMHAWRPQRVLRRFGRPTLAVRRPACMPYQRVLAGIHEARHATACIATAAGMAGGPHVQLLRPGVIDEAVATGIHLRDELEADSLARFVQGRIGELAHALGASRMKEAPAIAFTSSADVLLAEEDARFAELVVSVHLPSLARGLLARSAADALLLADETPDARRPGRGRFRLPDFAPPSAHACKEPA